MEKNNLSAIFVTTSLELAPIQINALSFLTFSQQVLLLNFFSKQQKRER